MIARILVKPFGTIWDLKFFCKKNNNGILAKLAKFLYGWYQYEHGSAISFKATFLDVPKLPNGTKQIIITEDVKLGTNCTIFQQVSIQGDALKSSLHCGSPIIGDNCYIYPGAKIIGGITVGNNVVIGANAVVTCNIPDNSIIEVKNTIVAMNVK